MLESASLPEGMAPARIALYAGIVVLGGAVGGYGIHEHHAAQNLAAKNVQATTELSATRHELTDLTAKVNMLAARAQAQAVPPANSAPVAAAHRRPSPAHRGPSREELRYNKLQSQIDAQGRALEQARTELSGDLANTRTELSGSIAHTHDELVLLEKKGERSYAEFDVVKSKEFRRAGPIEVRLRKANTKHQYADLELLVDDRNLSQKHVNLYQPIMFSTPDSPQPLEIVINNIGKNHIHGYVSAPRYGKSELASMSNASGSAQGSNQAPVNQSAPRQKLPLPQLTSADVDQ